jgi:peptide/nickel transport system substrate-binding protein
VTRGTDKAGYSRRKCIAITLVVLVGMAGCSPSDGPALSRAPSVLRIGFGLTTGTDVRAGLQGTALGLSLEGLITFGVDGRPRAWLAEQWNSSPERLVLSVRLRPGVTFHDGTPVTAAAVAEILTRRLPGNAGPSFEDVDRIHAVSESVVEIVRSSSPRGNRAVPARGSINWPSRYGRKQDVLRGKPVN